MLLSIWFPWFFFLDVLIFDFARNDDGANEYWICSNFTSKLHKLLYICHCKINYKNPYLGVRFDHATENMVKHTRLVETVGFVKCITEALNFDCFSFVVKILNNAYKKLINLVSSILRVHTSKVVLLILTVRQPLERNFLILCYHLTGFVSFIYQ